ncbi:glycolate oxidase subunit GlcF [Azohydromonas caseinilytica]|uniref:Glycolate oxidase iron-sulfur subunit n=1 Tax=Azohydromonas caseinilytica TaxID=2728836 RepID=A0A848F637_9BURK|nr:glycolate oxidase subunit GlcF [Azohydromonas caseinilytica]NML13823.1 glycolate oxidase subunit GlcF [Azohydromonas caseinilytica]
MQTNLAPEFRDTPEGQEAEAILRKCVHCGFCTATCPTYQILGDELDGPRGRIYLMKQVLEGKEPTRATQLHLDRCLTCRNCESTCPSGVNYGALADIGRNIVEKKVQRSAADRAKRWALKEGLTSPLFAPALKLGQALRPLVPGVLKDKLPAKTPARAHQWPNRQHARKVLMLAGCVQPAMAPNINAATARVLDAAGIQVLVAEKAGCCGAIRSHLSDVEGGLNDMRRNVDAWTPLLDQVEAIVMNASGCGVMVKDYGKALKHDPAYAERAARISALTKDLSELLPDLVPLLAPKLAANGQSPHRLTFHPPCTLQHGQQLRGGVESGLRALGFEVSLAAGEAHLCCGSAGTYSVLQPELSHQLRDRKLGQLLPTNPEAIVSANVGCIQHLQSGTDVPVRHWVEVVDEALAAG